MTDLHQATEHKRPAELDGRTEYLWWQILVGTSDTEEFFEWVLEGYLTKAMREAKTHTTWTSINEHYEQSVLTFARKTHKHQDVRALITNWHEHTAVGTRAATLAQKLVQLTMPGVPDVYQGTESLAPSLVDPDNRRPVDFAVLADSLARLDSGTKPRTLAQEKLAVTAAALRARAHHRDAFVGDGAGFHTLASSSGHAVVFARSAYDEPQAITVVTRVALDLERLGGWGEHTVQLPPGRWRDELSGAEFDGGATELADVLRSLPVALLVRA